MYQRVRAQCMRSYPADRCKVAALQPTSLAQSPQLAPSVYLDLKADKGASVSRELRGPTIFPAPHVVSLSNPAGRELPRITIMSSSSSHQQAQEDALRKMLVELQQSAINSSRALAASRTMVANKERERKLIQLTRNEIKDLDEQGKGERVYKGVGKMYVYREISSHTIIRPSIHSAARVLTCFCLVTGS